MILKPQSFSQGDTYLQTGLCFVETRNVLSSLAPEAAALESPKEAASP